MDEEKSYREYADECKRVAENTNDVKSKTGFLALSRYWQILSIKFDKKSTEGNSTPKLRQQTR